MVWNWIFSLFLVIEHTINFFGGQWKWDEGEELVWLCGLNAELYWRFVYVFVSNLAVGKGLDANYPQFISPKQE